MYTLAQMQFDHHRLVTQRICKSFTSDHYRISCICSPTQILSCTNMTAPTEFCSRLNVHIEKPIKKKVTFKKRWFEIKLKIVVLLEFGKGCVPPTRMSTKHALKIYSGWQFTIAELPMNTMNIHVYSAKALAFILFPFWPTPTSLLDAWWFVDLTI